MFDVKELGSKIISERSIRKNDFAEIFEKARCTSENNFVGLLK